MISGTRGGPDLEDDRTGLLRHHRYRLPDGRCAVAVPYWDGGVWTGVPYTGWCLMDDSGVNRFVTRGGVVTTYETAAASLRLPDFVDLGDQRPCVACDFPYDAACPHPPSAHTRL